MSVIHQSRTVPYTTLQMYELVDTVENYPDFVPYCTESIVHYRDEDEVQATLVISAAGMKKSFTTQNRHQPGKMIEIRLVDGPFSHLEGFWRFDETEEGCQITFDLEFQFSGMLASFLEPVFEQVTRKMIDAFCEQAEKQYGS